MKDGIHYATINELGIVVPVPDNEDPRTDVSALFTDVAEGTALVVNSVQLAYADGTYLRAERAEPVTYVPPTTGAQS